jgi:hypothetical protein
MDKLEAIALAQAAIKFVLDDWKYRPAAPFSRAELEQAAVVLNEVAMDSEPARKQAILEMLQESDRRKAGELSPDWAEFFRRI